MKNIESQIDQKKNWRIGRKTRVALWAVGGLIVLACILFGTLIILSRQAVGSYRSDASSQLNKVVNDQSADQSPVKLRGVWLGRLLEPEYAKVDDLQSTYSDLLAKVGSYVTVLNQHNNLVDQYNNGLKSQSDQLNSGLLSTVDNYMDSVKKHYPSESKRIAEMKSLRDAVAANTSFDAIRTSLNQVIDQNDTWLGQIRESINTEIAEFQKKIN